MSERDGRLLAEPADRRIESRCGRAPAMGRLAAAAAGLALALAAVAGGPPAQAQVPGLATAQPAPAPALAVAPTPAATPEPESEAADSPRASARTFVEATRKGDWAGAGRFLIVPPADEPRRAELARRLRAVLQRHLDIELDALSPLAEGNVQDGLPSGHELIGKVPGADGEDPVYIVRTRDANGPFWAFSRQTVSRIDGWYDALPDRWARDWVPEQLQQHGPARPPLLAVARAAGAPARLARRGAPPGRRERARPAPPRRAHREHLGRPADRADRARPHAAVGHGHGRPPPAPARSPAAGPRLRRARSSAGWPRSPSSGPCGGRSTCGRSS